MEAPYVNAEHFWISLLLGSGSCYLCVLRGRFVNVCSQEMGHTIFCSRIQPLGLDYAFAHEEFLYPLRCFMCGRL